MHLIRSVPYHLLQEAPRMGNVQLGVSVTRCWLIGIRCLLNCLTIAAEVEVLLNKQYANYPLTSDTPTLLFESLYSFLLLQYLQQTSNHPICLALYYNHLHVHK